MVCRSAVIKVGDVELRQGSFQPTFELGREPAGVAADVEPLEQVRARQVSGTTRTRCRRRRGAGDITDAGTGHGAFVSPAAIAPRGCARGAAEAATWPSLETARIVIGPRPRCMVARRDGWDVGFALGHSTASVDLEMGYVGNRSIIGVFGE